MKASHVAAMIPPNLVDRVTLVLPWPPSMNRYWRSITIKGQARVVLSADGREYRESVIGAVVAQRSPRVTGRVAVRVAAWVPDRRPRDLDNMFKAILDSLTHAGVIEDDSFIDTLAIRRRTVKPGGEVVVRIRRIDPQGELF